MQVMILSPVATLLCLVACGWNSGRDMHNSKSVEGRREKKNQHPKHPLKQVLNLVLMGTQCTI